MSRKMTRSNVPAWECIIVFAVLFVFVPLSFSASGKSVKTSLSVSKSADVDSKVPRAQVENKYGVAVIIGNQSYNSKDVPNVDYAISDARIVKKYVQKTLGYREGNIICLENATQAQFRTFFGIESDYKAKLYSYLRPDKSDIFIYYSGHGAPDVQTKTGYFVPVDCDPSTVRFNGYSLKLFYDNLAKLPARSITVVLDTCFSGGSEKGMLLKNASPVFIDVKNPLLTMKNACVLTSSTGDQISSWYPAKKHGLYTYYFLKGLQGEADTDKDGNVTGGELHNYLADEVSYMARRLYMREQQPQIMGSKNAVIIKYK
ncbi:MAG: caspase family protein [Desulfobacterales bacterium]|nr:caspase family protein [Desulfobacterales bacterium]